MSSFAGQSLASSMPGTNIPWPSSPTIHIMLSRSQKISISNECHACNVLSEDRYSVLEPPEDPKPKRIYIMLSRPQHVPISNGCHASNVHQKMDVESIDVQILSLFPAQLFMISTSARVRKKQRPKPTSSREHVSASSTQIYML